MQKGRFDAFLLADSDKLKHGQLTAYSANANKACQPGGRPSHVIISNRRLARSAVQPYTAISVDIKLRNKVNSFINNII